MNDYTVIKELTPEQAARLPEFRDKWLKIGLATGPTDRAAVEAGVDTTYKAAGLPPPALKIWLQSPLEGVIAAAILVDNKNPILGVTSSNSLSSGLTLGGSPPIWNQINDQIRVRVRNQILNTGRISDEVLAEIRIQVGAQVHDRIWHEFGKHVGVHSRTKFIDQTVKQIWNRIGKQVQDSNTSLGTVTSSLLDQAQHDQDPIVSQVLRCGFGSQDIGWLSFYDYIGSVLGFDVSVLDGLMALAKSGWWWAFEHAVVLTERPIAMSHDERGRLHHPTRAAIEYADGFGVCAWHGIRVPSEWILRPDKRDVNLALEWPQVEQRRALVEMMGWERVIAQLSPIIIDEDPDPQVGTLLRVDLPDSPGEQFLRVRCGTGRTFVLPVPASCRTALEANASTYDVPPEVIRLLEVRS